MSVILKLCVWRSAELCFVDDSIFFFYFCSVHIAHTTAAEGHRVDTQIANGMSKAAAAATTSAAYIFFLSHILLHLPSSSSLFEYKWGIHCCNSVKMMDGFDDAFACCSNVKLVQLGWEMHALNTLNQARGMSREGYCQSKAGGRWQMARHCRCNQCVFVCAESGRNVEMV